MRKLLVALTVLSFISCKKEKEEDDIVYSAWPITKVEGAATGSINQAIPITVSWPYSSGCDIVEKFAESRQGTTITITTLGYTRGGICTMDAGIKTIVYNFSATQAGVYTLKFVNNDSFIPRTVTIN